jgi:mannitol-1-/sugar-/sorbitol-6-phosphatase
VTDSIETAALKTVDVSAGGLLFDMDGVLISSIGSVIRCWRRWAQHYGVPGWETLTIPHGVRAIDIMEGIDPSVDKVEGLRRIEDMEIADVEDLQVLAGVRSLLESLPEGSWAIVTSATRRLMIGRLQAAGLPIPSRIIAADDVVKGKPDPEPYRRGAGLIGVDSAQCIVVEDAPSGVRAGIGAGCRVLGVLGTHAAEELRAAGANWVVPSLEKVQLIGTEGALSLRLEVLE